MADTTTARLRYGAAARSRGGLVLTRKIVLDCLQLFDFTVVAMGALVSHVIYLGRFADDGGGGIILFALYGLAGAFATLHALKFAGAYEFSKLIQTPWQMYHVLLAWLAVMAIGLTLAFLSKSSSEISRGWFLLWFAGSLTGMWGGRLYLAHRIRAWSAKGKFRRQIVLLTTEENREAAIRRFHNADDRSVALAGVFLIDEIASLATIKDIDEIILSLPSTDHYRLREIITALSALAVDVSLTVDLPVRSSDFRRFELRREGLVGHLSERPLKNWKPVHKRILDLLVACGAAVALAPAMALIALLIRLDSPGPVIFRQTRYGYANHPITIFKFRTLGIDKTDADAAKLVTRNDSRVTRVGRWLRKLSLDELPQIFNVIKGDMSVVGPRPHAMQAKAGDRLYEDVVKNYVARHRVKPGITGWAQVNGWRGETDNEEKILKRVEFDLYYIEHWSIWLDIRIMIKTAFVVFERRNAY